ncbi:hypothetical protein CEXT_361841 [Caerostris extrusa]|uniref:Uncharacterized protein n=1 Tax=Caerostris extrusa TaxID=172846 RepID=A0AAV4TXD0_CAEEX|nr:hypothetical protein CEXT_361841 [Caerostris extrusa]
MMGVGIGPPTKGPPTSSDTKGLEIEESGSTRSKQRVLQHPRILLRVLKLKSQEVRVLKRRSTKKGFSKILGYY